MPEFKDDIQLNSFFNRHDLRIDKEFSVTNVIRFISDKDGSKYDLWVEVDSNINLPYFTTYDE